MSNERTPAEIEESRRAMRLPVSERIQVRVKTERLEGVTENLSTAGIMFLTNDPVRVEVEIEESEGTQVKTGRIVRGQPMGGGRLGLAIEFDPS